MTKGIEDLANSWNVDGQARHIDVKQHFLWELKEGSLLCIKHVQGDENNTDLFMKNLHLKGKNLL